VLSYDIDLIQPNLWNANVMTEEEFEKLINSIKETKGKYLEQNPIEVRKLNGKIVEIINGEHRWKACKILGFKKIPVIIINANELEARRLCYMYNRNRGQISYLLFSIGLNEEKEKFNLTQEQLGEAYGYSRSTIKDILLLSKNLLKHHDKDWWRATNFSNRVMVALSRVKSDLLRKKLIEKTCNNKNWKSNTIRRHAKKFNEIVNYIKEIIEEQDESLILKEISDNILFDYDFPPLRNLIDELHYELSRQRILHGNCLDILPNLNYQWDHIITDPPYFISSDKNYVIPNRTPIIKDFGPWDHFDSIEVYLESQRKWLELAIPKLKDGGNILIFTSFGFGGFIMKILKELGLKIKLTSTWHKTNPPPNGKNCDLSSCEYIICATKGNNATYHWLGSKKAHNFIETTLCQGNERTSHPTQKPIEVIKWLLDKYTNPGDLILDPFAGSGSTGVACKEKGRNYILIEKNDDYFKMLKMRLNSCKDKAQL